MAPSLQSFAVRRQPAVLVVPASPTPYEFKLLSDIDDQEGLRFELPVTTFYRNRNNPMLPSPWDPTNLIKDSLAKALVYYYPLAGRIRASPTGKLTVECTGEGVLFVSADTTATLADFEDNLPPPQHIMDQLLYDIPGSGGVVNCPLLLVQVTRLTCGGFVLALRVNHVMSDAFGVLYLIQAIIDFATGATAPAVPPVWERELLSARTPPRITHVHSEYNLDDVALINAAPPQFPDMVQRSFFFGPSEIAALRKHLPQHLRRSSAFEMLSACLWRSRTIALAAGDNEEVRLFCAVNTRTKFRPALPAGYYGNAVAFAAAVTTVGKLCGNPLGYAIELVKKAKKGVTEEYMRSIADLMVVKGRPLLRLDGGFIVSDLTHVKTDGLDLGWAEVVYAGPAKGGPEHIAGLSSFFISFTNSKGEKGTMVPICLPRGVMDVFAMEVERMTTETSVEAYHDASSGVIYNKVLAKL